MGYGIAPAVVSVYFLTESLQGMYAQGGGMIWHDSF